MDSETERFICALEQLTVADLLRLARAAGYLMRSSDRAYQGQSAEDLLQEAILRTLEEKRRWKRDVPILKHLGEAMRSVVSSWAKSSKRESRRLGNPYFERNPEAPLIQESERAVESFLRENFPNDKIASAIVTCWWAGLKGPAICRELGISVNEYEAARKRIHRRLPPRPSQEP